jgi:hypothetical protein
MFNKDALSSTKAFSKTIIKTVLFAEVILSLARLCCSLK